MQIRLAGDLALFQGINKILIERDALDQVFIDESTAGFDELRVHLDTISWDDIEHAAGVPRAQIEKVAQMVIDARSVIVCWALGLTQHVQSVATIQEIVNLLLMTGNIGRPGAGLCPPVRGHSNVQGDRTQASTRSRPRSSSQPSTPSSASSPPREHGLDTVDAVRAMADGRGRFFLQMGGNFARVTGDTDLTDSACAAST